jgi:hypothetical protein
MGLIHNDIFAISGLVRRLISHSSLALEDDLPKRLEEAILRYARIKDHWSSLETVAEQLAAQGFIARSKISTGEPVLVLQVQEIERYAGSLILAARNNVRGVPALDLRAIAREDFPLPGIAEGERLPRKQEKPVVECTIQLMLEHGICFQHEGLLIFPSLFAPTSDIADVHVSESRGLSSIHGRFERKSKRCAKN